MTEHHEKFFLYSLESPSPSLFPWVCAGFQEFSIKIIDHKQVVSS